MQQCQRAGRETGQPSLPLQDSPLRVLVNGWDVIFQWLSLDLLLAVEQQLLHESKGISSVALDTRRIGS